MINLKQSKEMSWKVSRTERWIERNTLEKTHHPKNSLILARDQVSTESDVLSGSSHPAMLLIQVISQHLLELGTMLRYEEEQKEHILSFTELGF